MTLSHKQAGAAEQCTERELARDLRTVLVRLELVSSAPTSALNATGGGESDHVGPTGSATSPADHFRDRLARVDAGLQRRLDSAEAQGDEHQREREQANARTWARDARESILDAATVELAALTGRDGNAPSRRQAEVDTPAGLTKAIAETARAARKEHRALPADEAAIQLGTTKYTARRVYIEQGLDPHDGQPLGDALDRAQRARELHDRGLSERQIRDLLGGGIGTSTVRRWIGKAA